MIARVLARALALGVTAAGGSADDLLARARLTPRDLAEPSREITRQDIQVLWEHAPRCAKDDAFGLHAAQIVQALGSHPLDVLVYLVRSSATLAQAFASLSRYNRFLGEYLAFEFESAAGEARIGVRLVGVPTGSMRHAAECSVAAVLLRARTLTGKDLAPREVRFEHREPERTEEHRRIFRAPLLFEQPVNELVFDAPLLESPVLSADPRLCAMLDRQAQEMLAALPPTDALSYRVRGFLCEALGRSELSADAAARRLGISARTLQRRLREEGQSFSSVLDAVRHEAALRYLAEPQLTISEIAFALGFAEPGAFHRAFRRWTGQPPAVFRRSRSSEH
jgi:AraC-like DNA-binding protein